MSGPDDDGFMTRWSRRKALVRQGGPVPAEPPPAAAMPAAAPAQAAVQAQPAAGDAPAEALGDASAMSAPAAPPPPTLDDVARLDSGSDFRRFVAPEVDASVKNAALKKLFADPHFNVMDGLDTYIDDYNKADPLPRSMLRQMVQARTLGLLDDEVEDQHPVPGVEAEPLSAVPAEAVDDLAREPTPDRAPEPPPEPLPPDARPD